ncbi:MULTISPECIES: hypothetical protein [Ralstonia]|jgi:hypothetical protein|uniref:Uncharacterized protein n=2 Tax=Ralstonia pickettii TaxID=329 RepID=R0E6K7_RALPI|nr:MULTISPECIES: hypothetical protein [Ralstonia]ENZ77734.1 hypothetical protein OR214_02010 [Ralstonia pickettii OR214]MBL4779238.1 hypothetical protein [Ralstonia sp.]MCM3583865.1 hypothetical protein [Ralstonia pickettii]
MNQAVNLAESIAARLNAAVRIRDGSAEGETLFGADLSGYAAHAAAKELVENWITAVADVSSDHLLADVDQVIATLAKFKEQVQSILPAANVKVDAWSPIEGAMTDKQYVAHRGCRCPSCGNSEDLSGDSFNADGGTASQEMGCNVCEASWSDLYVLTGYSDLEDGISLEDVDSAVEDVRSRSKQYEFSVTGEEQALEVLGESCDILGLDLSEPEIKLAVAKLLS